MNVDYAYDVNGNLIGFEGVKGDVITFAQITKDAAGNVTGLATPSGTAVPIGRKTYLGQVATSQCVPLDVVPANKQMMSRQHHFARDDITALSLGYMNFYVAAGTQAQDGLETAIGTSAMTIEASVEYPSGTFTRVTFGGSNQGSCVAGGVIVSDACTVTIPAGAKFWTRTWTNNPDGIIFSNNASSFGNQLNYGVTTPNYVMSTGTISATTLGYGPSVIIGQTARPSVLILGDSRTAGILDTADATLNRGHVARAIGSQLAYMNFGVPSDRAMWVAANFAKRALLAQYCSHVVCQLGINDITLLQTAAQVHASLQTIYGFSAFAGKQIWQTTLEPFATSSDAFVTETNQTVRGDNSVRQTFNDTLRGGIAGIQGVIDIASALESATTSGKWAAPYGTALTSDGLHAVRRGYLRVQSLAGINPGMFVR